MTEKICKLCLRTILENNFQTIEETLKDSCCKLFLKLNMDLSVETEVCTDCMGNLQAFINFMSICDHIKGRTNNLSLKFEDLENTKSVDGQMKCYFCRNITVEENFTSLNESKEHIFLIELLKEYVPDLDLNVNEDVLTCEICLSSLQEFSNFIMNCLNVADRIKRYAEIERTNDKGQINLKDVKQFDFKPSIKLEGDVLESHERNQEKFDEEGVEGVELGELDIKAEEIDIKHEQLNESLRKSTEIKLDNGTEEAPWHKEEIYSLRTRRVCGIKLIQKNPVRRKTRKNALNDHIRTHKNPSKISMFKCESCMFETKYKANLNRHKLIHNSLSETTMYKCHSCTYETKLKLYLKRHLLIHKRPSEIRMFKCEMCTYETKYKSSLSSHISGTHNNVAETTLYKCDSCTYVTKHKPYLSRHQWIHKSPLEILMFKCEMCAFETTQKQILTKHQSIHKSSSERSIFKCEMCTFETTHKRNLSQHKTVHKNPSDVSKFKCDMCTYQTKNKFAIDRHITIHKNTSETTLHKPNLIEHQSIHKSPLETSMFQCEKCSYETKHKCVLKKHELSAHNSKPEVIYKCDLCNFITKHKRNLYRHNLLHISPSKLSMFKCELCSFQAKCKRYLNRHLLHRHKLNLSKPSAVTKAKFETKRKDVLKLDVAL